MKIIQVYAPTTAHKDEEVEMLYEDVTKAMNENGTRLTMIIGDFNTKLGKRKSGEETQVGPFDYGERNNRGETLIKCIEEKRLFAMNTFLRKKRKGNRPG